MIKYDCYCLSLVWKMLNILIQYLSYFSLIMFFLFVFFYIRINRKKLYQAVFEYDKPLFYPYPEGSFSFISPQETDYDNPWKESFKTLVSKFYHFFVKVPMKKSGFYVFSLCYGC